MSDNLADHTHIPKALSKHSIIGANETHIQAACYCEGFSAATAITQQCGTLNKKTSVYKRILLWRNIGFSKKKNVSEMSLWINKTNESLTLVTGFGFDLSKSNNHNIENHTCGSYMHS